MLVKAVELRPRSLPSQRALGPTALDWKASSPSSRAAFTCDFALQTQCILCEYRSSSTSELSVGFNWSHNFAQAWGGNLS